jgi:dTDP-glucose pyrophosphorylase
MPMRTALECLNRVPKLLTLLVVDEAMRLVGTLTDGDIRRALLRGVKVEALVSEAMCRQFRYVQQQSFDLAMLRQARQLGIRLVPVVDADMYLVDAIDTTQRRSWLPLDAVVMAGGEGARLRPLTLHTPKPLLRVGDKPIIEHNIDRLIAFGIQHIHISVKYLAEQIVQYFEEAGKAATIHYIHEHEPLGTIGAVSLIDTWHHDYVLVMNSDLLTDIDFEDMFLMGVESNGDMIVATTPYEVKIPYGIVETHNNCIISLKEKPTYTYYSNAGIYMIRRSMLAQIPRNTFFNATDLIETIIAHNGRVVNYPILGYWLDIGKHDDFAKAQMDIRHLNL